ncbi:MAG: NUDIX hydrolase [Dehalococcoidia bacterium]|nr:NUDIX hydrolase [Dehalococcoidia bacterium]
MADTEKSDIIIQNPYGPTYWFGKMSFCPKCGSGLSRRRLESEDRDRLVCGSCQFILYENPKVVAGVLPIKSGGIVLLRRGIQPRIGTWTFPSGFMELNESAEEAAVRETKEETNLEVANLKLLNVYSRVTAGIVVVVYTADVLGGVPSLGHETLEIAEFSPSQIPWSELAFDTTKWAIEEWHRRLKG